MSGAFKSIDRSGQKPFPRKETVKHLFFLSRIMGKVLHRRQLI